MATLRVTSLRGRTAGTSPELPDGAVVTGVTTTGSAIVGAAVTINASGVDAGAGIITSASSVVAGIVTTNSTGIDAGAGIITATSFVGSGANLTGVVSGVELQFSGASVGAAVTNINLAGFSSVTAPVAGLSTITVAGWEVRDTWLYGGG